jgi:hypothetical protein
MRARIRAKDRGSAAGGSRSSASSRPVQIALLISVSIARRRCGKSFWNCCGVTPSFSPIAVMLAWKLNFAMTSKPSGFNAVSSASTLCFLLFDRRLDSPQSQFVVRRCALRIEPLDRRPRRRDFRAAERHHVAGDGIGFELVAIAGRPDLEPWLHPRPFLRFAGCAPALQHQGCAGRTSERGGDIRATERHHMAGDCIGLQLIAIACRPDLKSRLHMRLFLRFAGRAPTLQHRGRAGGTRQHRGPNLHGGGCRFGRNAVLPGTAAPLSTARLCSRRAAAWLPIRACDSGHLSRSNARSVAGCLSRLTAGGCDEVGVAAWRWSMLLVPFLPRAGRPSRSC